MPFPNFEGKHAHDPLFSPKDFLEYAGQGEPEFTVPEAVIFSYQDSLLRYVREEHGAREVKDMHPGKLYLLPETEGRVGLVGDFGIGAPVAAATLEELYAMGVERFVSVGTAGTLQPDVEIGSLVVCDRAVRDEGTSYHYLPASRFAHAEEGMTRRLTAALDSIGHEYRVGASWTTDAPYRETVEEARHYQEEGVLCVEMELSALFAVAEVLGAPIGALLTVSDSLAELEWRPAMHEEVTRRSLEDVFLASVRALDVESGLRG